MPSDYCRRCDRSFVSATAKRQHVLNSSMHNVCIYCNPQIDFGTRGELDVHWDVVHLLCSRCGEFFEDYDDHWEDAHNWCAFCNECFDDLDDHRAEEHNWCSGCDCFFHDAQDLEEHKAEEHNWCPGCDEFFDDWDDLEQHRADEHNKCLTCGDYFSSPSNLKYHLLTHADKNVECFACYRTFVTESAMVLHLEVGGCPSGLDREDIDNYARLCRQAAYYIDYYGEYMCPTCDKTFNHMSGLLQHAESDYCDESLKRWTSPLAIFLRFLKSCVS